MEKHKIVLPDYKNCIANLPNSILKKLGLPTNGDTLPLLDKYLQKDYKNIVVILLDGMGKAILVLLLLRSRLQSSKPNLKIVLSL